MCKHECLSARQLKCFFVFGGFELTLFVTDDFRIFCGDLGNEVNDDILARAFSRYPSFLKAKVQWSFLCLKATFCHFFLFSFC